MVDLFSGAGCPRISSIEYAHNDSWYVNFESDEEAQAAFVHLRTKVQTFKGKPILVSRTRTGRPRAEPSDACACARAS